MRDGPEQKALGLLAVGALGVRQRLQPVKALLGTAFAADLALAPPVFELGFLRRGEAVLGAQPGQDGLVVGADLQQALRRRAAVQPAAAIKLGRHNEFFQRPDVGGRNDHDPQLMFVELAARDGHMASEPKLHALLVLPQPRHDALRFALPDGLDASVPAPANAIDALDQLVQGEDAGGFKMTGKRRVQPVRDRVASFGGLGNQGFEPPQRVELACDQSGASAQVQRCMVVFSLEGRGLGGLRFIFQATGFGEGFEGG